MHLQLDLIPREQQLVVRAVVAHAHGVVGRRQLVDPRVRAVKQAGQQASEGDGAGGSREQEGLGVPPEVQVIRDGEGGVGSVSAVVVGIVGQVGIARLVAVPAAPRGDRVGAVHVAQPVGGRRARAAEGGVEGRPLAVGELVEGAEHLLLVLLEVDADAEDDVLRRVLRVDVLVHLRNAVAERGAAPGEVRLLVAHLDLRDEHGEPDEDGEADEEAADLHDHRLGKCRVHPPGQAERGR
mmetsp:Transcript_492/g.1262  ORF Transcript_492/g.1262 Transcript_492/m.1262 type:complete len:239 (-) Transcript_492:2003-2719(-)